MEAEMEKLKEGMVLEQDTCDEIQIDLYGNTRRINEHTEHWLIKDITANYYVLYDLDTQRTWRIKKEEMKYFLAENKKLNIRPMLRISKEVA